MKRLDEKYGVRELLVAALERDLEGPESANEVIPDAPIQRYLTGALYPRDAGNVSPDLDDARQADATEDDEGDDAPVSLANMRYPSSLGMTFAIDTAMVSSFELKLTCGVYREIEEPGELQGHWRRRAVGPIRIDVAAAPATNRYPAPGQEPIEPGLELYVRVRDPDDNGFAAVTAVIVNRNVAKAMQRDAASFFQVRLEASADDRPAFVARALPSSPGASEDEVRTYQLLYRHAVSYAVGHGTAVMWDETSPGRSRHVSTCAIPRHELLLADTNPNIRLVALDMQWLAEAPREELAAGLTELCEGYAKWIGDQEGQVQEIPPALVATAQRHLDDCRHALERMNEGVELLTNNEQALTAFRVANRAMALQRARTDWHRQRRPAGGPTVGEQKWHPFQLAFILLNLPSIADPGHRDREVADLLWFPTGGGKTEAYLGIIAFTAVLRRLRHGPRGGGVTAFMRYTLRLLTLQQFQRAALLMCCLEHLRRSRDDLGTAEMSIGLWVGKDGTPAKRSDARTILNKTEDAQPGEGSPMQVHSCPWCGSRLARRNYWLAKTPPKLVIACRNEDCEFSQGVPVYVVDEDLYDYRPTLIIATADKFASLPWTRRARDIFNLDSQEPPPELIIQDELHLISGPLGTLAGLYETAIDRLCLNQGQVPKIIASTATIRRAGPQMEALFSRRMRQFPPPGLDARDSWFAVEAPRSAKASRLYVGAMTPGTSHAMLMIRTYAALFQAIRDVDAAPEDQDPYWTLVGYFNSLRVLGAARMQVQDDVRDRLEALAPEERRRNVDLFIELTSREPSGRIPEYLEHMEVELPDPETLDYLLATNMISVGVDIDRLGLMVVMGQPQATAEYIQATSRVGRSWPGLVIALYNAGRSRDRSHYESFVGYHSALYRQVESTSVTPFSARARDRGLHAIVIGLARLMIPGMDRNDGARLAASHRPDLLRLKDDVVQRARAVDPDKADAVDRELTEVIDEWADLAKSNAKLVYANPYDLDNSLMVSAERTDLDHAFPTMSSLRDVDVESNLYLARMI